MTEVKVCSVIAFCAEKLLSGDTVWRNVVVLVQQRDHKALNSPNCHAVYKQTAVLFRYLFSFLVRQALLGPTL